MSKVFYDHILDLSDVEKKLKKKNLPKEEREEIEAIIDEMVHHRVVGCILDKLPKGYHDEFLHNLSQRPHDEAILDYLKEKMSEDVIEFIKQEVRLLAAELHEELDRKLA